MNDDFNGIVVTQVWQALWTAHSSETGKAEQQQAVVAALMGIAPRDELEAMIGAQLIAAHHASMECFRRAMISEQTFEGRKDNLNQATKLTRSYAMLLDALNRHRGKGQQKVTVEHVHVAAGGQAIVGTVEAGGGVANGNRGQPHAQALSHAPQSPLWSEDQERESVSITSDAER